MRRQIPSDVSANLGKGLVEKMIFAVGLKRTASLYLRSAIIGSPAGHSLDNSLFYAIHLGQIGADVRQLLIQLQTQPRIC
jgi:hypothetical protein